MEERQRKQLARHLAVTLVAAVSGGLLISGLMGGGYGEPRERAIEDTAPLRPTDSTKSVLVESTLLWYDTTATPNPAVQELVELAETCETLDSAKSGSARRAMRALAIPASTSTSLWFAPSIVAQHGSSATVEFRSASPDQDSRHVVLHVRPKTLDGSYLRVGYRLTVVDPEAGDELAVRSNMTLKDGRSMLLDLGPLPRAETLGGLLLLLRAKKVSG